MNKGERERDEKRERSFRVSVKSSGSKKEKLKGEATAANTSSYRLKYLLAGYNPPTISSAWHS